MECFLTSQLKVDTYSTFCFATNRYSVPDHLVGKLIEVKIYSEKLIVYYQNNEVCQHGSNYGMHKWQINIDHYLYILGIKPGALAGSVALRKAPDIVRKIYQDHFRSSPRDFIELLPYCQKHDVPHKKLSQAVMQVEELCPQDVRAEKIIVILGNRPGDVPVLSVKDNAIVSFAQEQLAELTSLIKN
jgi:hypothetical protein